MKALRPVPVVNANPPMIALTALRCVFVAMLGVISMVVPASALGGLAPPAQRDAKQQTAPQGAYRELVPTKDGLDFTLAGLIIRWQNAGAKMDAAIGGITFTNTRGQQLQVDLASHSVISGQIRTVEFGIIYLKIQYRDPPTAPQLVVTDRQIRQIKKKLETAAPVK